MSNFLYDKARESFLNAQINWTSDTIKAVYVDTALYTPNQSTHQFLSDIAAGARVYISAAFTGKTTTGGVANAAPLTPPGITGASIEALVIFQDTGVATTSRLIAYIDTVASGLPVTPNGGPINTTWDTGANKIFKL